MSKGEFFSGAAQGLQQGTAFLPQAVAQASRDQKFQTFQAGEADKERAFTRERDEAQAEGRRLEIEEEREFQREQANLEKTIREADRLSRERVAKADRDLKDSIFGFEKKQAIQAEETRQRERGENIARENRRIGEAIAREDKLRAEAREQQLADEERQRKNAQEDRLRAFSLDLLSRQSEILLREQVDIRSAERLAQMDVDSELRQLFASQVQTLTNDALAQGLEPDTDLISARAGIIVDDVQALQNRLRTKLLEQDAPGVKTVVDATNRAMDMLSKGADAQEVESFVREVLTQTEGQAPLRRLAGSQPAPAPTGFEPPSSIAAPAPETNRDAVRRLRGNSLSFPGKTPDSQTEPELSSQLLGAGLDRDQVSAALQGFSTTGTYTRNDVEGIVERANQFSEDPVALVAGRVVSLPEVFNGVVDPDDLRGLDTEKGVEEASRKGFPLSDLGAVVEFELMSRINDEIKKSGNQTVKNREDFISRWNALKPDSFDDFVAKVGERRRLRARRDLERYRPGVSTGRP